MSENGKIARILVIMALSFLVPVILFFKFITPQYDLSYDRAVADKVHRADIIQMEKIMFVGNSATAFGYRCETIEELLDYEYMTVNLGMHGSLGNTFQENMAKRSVKPGDYVILGFTDYLGETWEMENSMYAWIAIENDFDLWSLVGRQDIFKMVDAFPVYAKKCVRLWHTKMGNQPQEFGYSRWDFNAYGDDAYCDTIGGYFKVEGEALAEPVEFDQEGIARVNAFVDYIDSKGATVLLVCPTLMTTNPDQDDTEIVNSWQEFTSQLKCDCITDISEYMMSNEMFYDNKNHLNTEGAQLRSQMFARDFKNYVKAQ